MRTNDLLEIEERISTLLREEEKKNGERQVMLRKIQGSIKERQELCQRLEKEKQERINRVNRQKEALQKAKSIVAEKEDEEIEKKKENLRKEYTDVLSNVNEVELIFTKDMTKTIEKILEMKNHAETSGFSSLSNAVSCHVMDHIKEFIVEAKTLAKSLRVDKLIDLIKEMNRSISMVDKNYSKLEKRRELYVGELFKNLEESFSEHFFSQFDTNRLDKPEWYLEYLINQILEQEKLFAVFSQVDELSVEIEEDDEEFEQKNKQKYFHSYIDKIFINIVFKKLNECVYSASKQQKELIMHHASEIGAFTKKLNNLYNYKDKPSILEKDLVYIQDVFIEVSKKELQHILKKEYVKWNEMFLYLLKKIFKQATALHSIIPSVHTVLLEEAIRKYLQGVSAFLNSFLYKKEEEQKILVYFIEEISHLEEELLEIETEFGMAVGEITILKIPCLSEFKQDMQEILQRILEEKLENVMHPFVNYGYMDDNEQEEVLCNLSETIESLASFSEVPEISNWIHSMISEIIDECICQNKLSEKIDYDSDKKQFKKLVDKILEMFRENNIQHSLTKTGIDAKTI